MEDSFRAQAAGYSPANNSIGTTYDKALYRGYTDSTFTARIEQPPWQGYMGPTIRAEVGDLIEVRSHHSDLLESISSLLCRSL
jgi:manganese oxidase